MNQAVTASMPTKGTPRVYFHYLLAAVAGVLCHLGFAPYELEVVTPLAIAIVYAQLTLSGSFTNKRAFMLGLSFGFGLFLSGLRWVHVSLDTYGGMPLPVTILLLCLLALYLAVFAALSTYVFNKLKQRNITLNALLFAALWISFEWARGEFLTGVPWLFLGYSQTQGVLAPAGATIGTLGLSFVIVLLAALIVNLFKRSVSSVVLFALTLAGSIWLTTIETITIEPKTTKLALVQGNIAQNAKWQQETMWPTISRYVELTREHFDADVIIWPEAAVPAVEGWVKDYLKALDAEALRNNTAIITGIIARTTTLPSDDSDSVSQKYYNALISLGQDDGEQTQPQYGVQHTNRYYKHQLLPIGEFVPFADILRPLAPLFNLPMSSFTRGGLAQPNLNSNGVKLAPAICYEIAFADLVRQNIAQDTDFILTVSNDAWFGRSIGPHQHMQLAQMRAIEFGRPVIRVTNNGITAIVNTQGEITQRLPQFEEGVLRANIHSVSGQTYFYRYGNQPLFGLCGLIIFICVFICVFSYRQATTG